MRWLLLVWDESGERESSRHQGVDLPRRRLGELSNSKKLAIGVLAQDRIMGLLQSLCRQAGSWDLSRDKDRMPVQRSFSMGRSLDAVGFGERLWGNLNESLRTKLSSL